MNPRAREIIDQLQLTAHPEGGRYRRVFCSALEVVRDELGTRRPALTSIYYLLLAGETGRWHRVLSDEAWHFHEGAPLLLSICPPGATTLQQQRLGPLARDTEPLRVVPAGHWQQARTLGDYSLVACSVGPGFDFADFTLASSLPPEQEALRARLLHWSTDEDAGHRA